MLAAASISAGRPGSAGDYQRTLGCDQGIGDALGQSLGFGVQAVNGRCARIDGVGHGEAQASQVRRRCVHALLGDVVELGFS